MVMLALLLGFVGLVLVFSDVGSKETWVLRVAIVTTFFFFAGAAIGFIYPEGWPIAILASWGAVLLGGFIVLMALARYGAQAFSAVEPPYLTSGLTILFGPLLLTAIGALIGKSLSRGRANRRQITE